MHHFFSKLDLEPGYQHSELDEELRKNTIPTIFGLQRNKQLYLVVANGLEHC